MKNVDRMLRVSELLLATLAAVVREEVSHPQLQHCTFTRVDPSRDLSVADVWFLSHNDDDPAQLEEQFNRAAGYIRSGLFARLELKRIPSLRFHYDKALVEGAELSMHLGEHDE